MYELDSIVLYVEDVPVSRKFYQQLLGAEGEQLSPSFVSFPLASGMKLELKGRAQSQPPSNITGGGTELSFKVRDEQAVRKLYEEWKGRGVSFAQQPTTLVFGPTFVALDPNGHRLRVFALK